MTGVDSIEGYKLIAKRIRRKIIGLVHHRKAPHVGPSLSTVEILVSLYFRCMNVSPQDPFFSNRDRLIFSKGHACPALYVTLNEAGFLDQNSIDGFGLDAGTLEWHPNRDVSKGIELSTGSLGHGLSVGAGMALGGKRDGYDHRVFVLLGDGELNEGSIWEAVMFASHHKIDNLIAIIDHNGMQALGDTERIIDLSPLRERWASFGWGVKEVNGHSFTELIDAFDSLPLCPGKPSAVICRTTKGKGVSFMENQLLWHYRAPDDAEYLLALEELSK